MLKRQNSKTKIVTNLKNSNWDKSQNSNMETKLNTQFVTKLKHLNSNSAKAHKFKKQQN